jgi:small conductance mechanosensitive channel
MQENLQQGVDFVNTSVQTVTKFLIEYGFDALGALLILGAGFVGSRWAANATFRFLQGRRIDLTVAKFAGGAVRGLIFGFALIVALGKLGITIAPIVAGLSALAIGSTFALQGVLSNMGSGLSLLFFKPFKIGDTITVAEVSGVVEEVKLGSTVLTNEDGERIMVPNRHIVGEVVRNSFAYRAADTVVGISYGDDSERAIEAVRGALARVSGVATDPAAQVGIQAFADSSINIGVRYWAPTRQYRQVCHAVNLAIYQAVKAAGLTIPFSQRDVHLVSQQSPAV